MVKLRVCDARAPKGFGADRGYSPENFRVSGVRFITRANPDPMSLTLSHQKEESNFFVQRMTCDNPRVSSEQEKSMFRSVL